MDRVLALVGVAALLVGCGAPTRSYQVSVRNDSPEPLTLWLTKTAGPIERRWRAPEHLAIERPGLEDAIGGVVVDSGQTASTPRVSGRFPGGTEAVLRVYRGERTLSDLLSISRGSPNRIDVILEPGVNDLVAREVDGRIVVNPSRSAGDATR